MKKEALELAKSSLNGSTLKADPSEFRKGKFMMTVQMYPTDEGFRTFNDDKNQASQRLAEVSLLNGSVSAAARDAALTAAQHAGVTTSQYLRDRLLQGAGISTQ
jgi:hypothetical protein